MRSGKASMDRWHWTDTCGKRGSKLCSSWGHYRSGKGWGWRVPGILAGQQGDWHGWTGRSQGESEMRSGHQGGMLLWPDCRALPDTVSLWLFLWDGDFEQKSDENKWEGGKEKAGNPCRMLLRESRWEMTRWGCEGDGKWPNPLFGLKGKADSTCWWVGRGMWHMKGKEETINLPGD